MCKAVFDELNILLGTPNEPFLGSFAQEGEVFIREHMQRVFEPRIAAVLSDGETPTKSEAGDGFGALDGGQKLLVALSASASA